MPQKDNNSMWVEGIDPAPAPKQPRKSAPKQTPFQREFGMGKVMPKVQNVGKDSRKRLSKS